MSRAVERRNPPARASLRVRIVVFLVSLALSVPMTFLLTFLLLPFWSWIEARYAIEAVGHSGPADWCFWLVFVVCFLIWNLLGLRVRPRGDPRDGVEVR